MNYTLILAEGDDVETKPGQPIPTGNEEAGSELGTKTDGGKGVVDTVKTPLTPTQKIIQYAPFIVIMIIMYMFIFRGPKKKQQQHAQMVKSLKKNDRVRTIGGIFGTVIEVRDKDVIIKIDESNNTKIRVSPSAISTVTGDEKE
jgi:preprotein translocase subunit YajC